MKIYIRFEACSENYWAVVPLKKLNGAKDTADIVVGEFEDIIEAGKKAYAVYGDEAEILHTSRSNGVDYDYIWEPMINRFIPVECEGVLGSYTQPTTGAECYNEIKGRLIMGFLNRFMANDRLKEIPIKLLPLLRALDNTKPWGY